MIVCIVNCVIGILVILFKNGIVLLECGFIFKIYILLWVIMNWMLIKLMMFKFLVNFIV